MLTDEERNNDATIRGVFSNNFPDHKGLRRRGARAGAALLRSGSLATVIYPIEVSAAVGPSLGRDNIDKGPALLFVPHPPATGRRQEKNFLNLAEGGLHRFEWHPVSSSRAIQRL